jgi:hypothetical protein
MPYLPPAPARALPLVAGDAYAPVELASPAPVSNGVKGFEYVRWKLVVYTIGTFAGLLLLPLWPFFIAKEAKDWSIARQYFKTMRYCLKALWDHITYGSFFRMWKYNITHGPDYVRRRISQRRGACTRCAKCCRAFNCIFLGQDKTAGDYYCKVFGTSYWYYGTCGRYPIDEQDIIDHGCPGFSFPKTPEELREARRTLPPKRLPVLSS